MEYRTATNRGAVYIYYGSSTGLSDSRKQVKLFNILRVICVTKLVQEMAFKLTVNRQRACMKIRSFRILFENGNHLTRKFL